jgi:hypothetical protein
MIKQLSIAASVIFISCEKSEKSKPAEKNYIPLEIQAKTINAEPNKIRIDREKAISALSFINGYIENSNKLNQGVDMLEWVSSNNLTTKKFRIELKKIIDDANKADPELGIDFDPIVDGQDHPDKGFEIEQLDKTDFIIVRGIDWPDFKLTMKMVEENGNWLVDGCGVVNIPSAKRAKR